MQISYTAGDGNDVGITYFEPIVEPGIRGNFNEDDLVDAGDIDLLTQAIRDNSTDDRFDLNDDGMLDEDDLNVMVTDVLNTRFGDTDLDGDVDFADFLNLSKGFGTDAGWSGGNFNIDAAIGNSDFRLMSENFGWKDDPQEDDEE